MKTLICFLPLLVACAFARTAFDWGVAECAILDQSPQPPEVTVVCDIIDAGGAVVNALTMKASPEEAAGIVARHPVKLGHPDPRLQVSR